MKKLFGKFMKEDRGDVVQYVIVLAVIAVILAFAFPKIKTMISDQTTKLQTDVGTATTDMTP